MSTAAIAARDGRASTLRGASTLALLASIAAGLLLYLGPPGTDFAAHSYQKALYAAHGFTLWNNYWYSGRYSFITYSALYYPVAALLGIRVLALLCVGTAVLAFSVVVDRRWGRSTRWSRWSVAIVLPAFVLSAAFPFLLGTALALLALLSLQSRRWPPFAALCCLTAAASPLAFLLLVVVVVAVGMGEECTARTRALGLGIVGAITMTIALLEALFPSQAFDPFPVQAFVPAVVFWLTLAGITWRLEAARSLRWIALLNVGAAMVAFVTASPIGEGIIRLRFFALPIALLALGMRRWRPYRLSAVAVVLVSYWNAAPLVTSFAQGVRDASRRASYWQPAIDYLHGHLTPAYRVEVVDTEHHWAATYLPLAGIPLARGWFRQDDFPQNAPLYDDDLSPGGYQRWLQGLAVRFVVLTDRPPDYSARREARLLRSGRSRLRRVLRTQHLQIFELPSAPGIITGPSHPQLVHLSRQGAELRAASPGTYRIAIRYSPYWHASAGCLTAGGDGMLRLRLGRPATVRLRFGVGVSSLVRVLEHRGSPTCATGRHQRVRSRASGRHDGTSSPIVSGPDGNATAVNVTAM